MTLQLSKLGEQKLKQSLIDTLRNQIRLLEITAENKNYKEIKSIGHSLRGNSGAAYFGLIQVGEIGRLLEQNNDPTENTILAVIHELRGIVNQLSMESE